MNLEFKSILVSGTQIYSTFVLLSPAPSPFHDCYMRREMLQRGKNQFCKRHLSLFRALASAELFRHISYEVKLMSVPERTEEQTAKHNFQRDRALGITFPGEFHRARFRALSKTSIKEGARSMIKTSPHEDAPDDTFSRSVELSPDISLSDSSAWKCTRK